MFCNSCLLYGCPAPLWLCWSFGSCTSMQHCSVTCPVLLLPATQLWVCPWHIQESQRCYAGWIEGNLFPPSCTKSETVLRMELLLFFSRGNLFLERVFSRDAQHLFVVTFGFNVQAALCILWLWWSADYVYVSHLCGYKFALASFFNRFSVSWFSLPLLSLWPLNCCCSTEHHRCSTKLFQILPLPTPEKISQTTLLCSQVQNEAS